MKLQGRTILVTGASRGIGAELAKHLIMRGAHVLGVSRAGFETPGVTSIALDLETEGAARELADLVARDHPDCSGLILNAAIMEHVDLTQGTHDDRIARETTINLTAPMQLSVAMLPQLAENGPGFINFVTSGLAIAPRAEAATYCATKAGLRSFARSLRNQCRDAQLGLHVSETIMTLVETTLSRELPNRYPPTRAAADLLAGIEAEKNEIWIERTRLLRIVHRVSPDAAYRVLRGPNVRKANSA